MHRTEVVAAQPRDSLQKLNYQTSQDEIGLILDTLQRLRPSFVLMNVMSDIELINALHGQLLDTLPNLSRSIAHVLVNSTFATMPARKPAKLTKLQLAVLNSWVNTFVDAPYPSTRDKNIIAEQTGLTTQQVSTWFMNFRKRNWGSKLFKHFTDNIAVEGCVAGSVAKDDGGGKRRCD